MTLNEYKENICKHHPFVRYLNSCGAIKWKPSNRYFVHSLNKYHPITWFIFCIIIWAYVYTGISYGYSEFKRDIKDIIS